MKLCTHSVPSVRTHAGTFALERRQVLPRSQKAFGALIHGVMARASGTYHVPVTRFFGNFSFVREGLVTTCNRPQASRARPHGAGRQQFHVLGSCGLKCIGGEAAGRGRMKVGSRAGRGSWLGDAAGLGAEAGYRATAAGIP